MNCPKCGYAMSDSDLTCPRCKLSAATGSESTHTSPSPFVWIGYVCSTLVLIFSALFVLATMVLAFVPTFLVNFPYALAPLVFLAVVSGLLAATRRKDRKHAPIILISALLCWIMLVFFWHGRRRFFGC